MQVFSGRDDRWSVEQYVHWGVATFPAILVARDAFRAGHPGLRAQTSLLWLCARAGRHCAVVQVAGVAGAARRCGRHVRRGPCSKQHERLQHARYTVSACCADTAHQACLQALALTDRAPVQVPAGAGGLQQLRGVPLRSHGLLHPGLRPPLPVGPLPGWHRLTRPAVPCTGAAGGERVPGLRGAVPGPLQRIRQQPTRGRHRGATPPAVCGAVLDRQARCRRALMPARCRGRAR